MYLHHVWCISSIIPPLQAGGTGLDEEGHGIAHGAPHGVRDADHEHGGHGVVIRPVIARARDEGHAHATPARAGVVIRAQGVAQEAAARAIVREHGAHAALEGAGQAHALEHGDQRLHVGRVGDQAAILRGGDTGHARHRGGREGQRADVLRHWGPP